MTTPEQLAKWREEFEMQLLPATEMTRDAFGNYCLNGLEKQWQGYLRRCQKTEQIMKLAKFGAMIIENIFPDDPELFSGWMVEAGLLDKQHEYTPNIKATIKELLNDH